MSEVKDLPAAQGDLLHTRVRAGVFRRVAQPVLSRVLLRPNAMLFYGIAVASLLEPLAGKAADQTIPLFQGQPKLCQWLQADWFPRRVARSHELRAYIARLWPEFDCEAAQDRLNSMRSRSAAKAPPSSAAEAALVRCTMAAQSALFYRCLGSWAEDVELRRMAHEMALEDQAAFGRFQVAYAEAARTERLGVYGAWRTATECMRDARDHYVCGAFEAVSDEWGPNSPFGVVSYDDFVRRTRALVGTYGGLGPVERLVFRPWRKRPVMIQKTRASKPAWFRPVLPGRSSGTGMRDYPPTLGA